MAVIDRKEKRRGQVRQTKVKRYWPGKAPEWGTGEVDEEDEDVRLQKVIDVLDSAFPKNDDDLEVPRKDDDPRLRRLAQNRIEHRGEVRADHRRRQVEIISTEEEEEELREQETIGEEEDEERRRIREKNLKRAKEEPALLPVEEEEESEYETDYEDDKPGITMIKTYFVPKTERDTIAERERLKAEEKALEESAKKKLEMRKVETKQIVVEEVRKDEEIRKNMLLEEAYIEEDAETDDDINEAEEYKVWMTREIARIKRERDPKQAMLREIEDISSAQPKKKRKIHIN